MTQPVEEDPVETRYITAQVAQTVFITAPGPRGQRGATGEGAEDPPIDLTVLFENALAGD